MRRTLPDANRPNLRILRLRTVVDRHRHNGENAHPRPAITMSNLSLLVSLQRRVGWHRLRFQLLLSCDDDGISVVKEHITFQDDIEFRNRLNALAMLSVPLELLRQWRMLRELRFILRWPQRGGVAALSVVRELLDYRVEDGAACDQARTLHLAEGLIDVADINGLLDLLSQMYLQITL